MVSSTTYSSLGASLGNQSADPEGQDERVHVILSTKVNPCRRSVPYSTFIGSTGTFPHQALLDSRLPCAQGLPAQEDTLGAPSYRSRSWAGLVHSPHCGRRPVCFGRAEFVKLNVLEI